MFKRLLVPLDGSELAEQAIPLAACIASASSAAIDLVRIHAAATDSARRDAKYLEGIASELGASPGLSVTHAAPEGEPIDTIVQRSREIDADLIVLASHGRGGLGRLWMGSVADGVVRRSRIPVLVVRASKTAPGRGERLPLFKRILVPLDGSELSLEALRAAASLAACSDAQVALLHVVRPVPMPDAQFSLRGAPVAIDRAATEILVRQANDDLELAARTLKEQGVRAVETHVVVNANAVVAIVRFACDHQTQLIAMSTHGRGMSGHLLGSVAEKVLRASGLPVLLYRPASVSTPTLNLSDIEAQLPSLSAF